ARLYAAFGDREAARRLAGGQASGDFGQFPYERNFPLEWTRLAALLLHSAGQRIALGDAEGLAEVIELRSQIRQALGEQAQNSPLGLHLLGLERRIVEQAEAAWREKGEKALADQAAAVLADWPRRIPVLPLEEPAAFWSRALGASAQGCVLAATPPGKALDFLQLPFPPHALDGALLFFDEQGRLVEGILTYTARIQDVCPRASELSAGLAAWVSADAEATPTRSVQSLPGWTVETRLGPVDATVGAWVRLIRQGYEAAGAVRRELGPVHLDRRFESNRLLVAPQRLDDPLVLKEEPALERFGNPLKAGSLLDVTLFRVPERDLLQKLRLRYRPGTPWQQIALPLFAELGPGQWTPEGAGGTHGPRLRITWQDAVTQLDFSIPQEFGQPLTVELADRRESPDDVARWQEAVRRREEDERRDRLSRGQPIQRLPRKLDYLPLGADKDEVLRYLPKGQSVLKREFDHGMLVVINTPPPREGPPFMARQVIVQFGPDNKLAAARIRYDVAVKPRNAKEADWPRTLLEPWRQAGGVVAATASPYALRSQGLPGSAPGTFYRWRDDLTEATYLSDRGGVEITLTDRTLGHEPPPLSYLTTGPAEAIPGCVLGASRADFEAACPGRPVETPEGGWAVGVAQGPYDAVVVWFNEHNRIQRITARFRANDPSKTGAKDMEKALTDRWGVEIRQVGWPVWRDFSPHGALQSLTWFDDVVRYRLFWADNDNSPPRLWAEWTAPIRTAVTTLPGDVEREDVLKTPSPACK
ncbi:MAG: hypothetical protein NZM31_05935, partial [Gemmatales bacterium]|nr:hypothetical protein [Gemmatales bacterium]MDW8386538.1 hypothetical protein [Gemmatales bacterium]